MQSAITIELMKMLKLAVTNGLVPPDTRECEFTVDQQTGQASIIEHWPCIERKPDEYTKVIIPPHLIDQFVFHTVKSLSFDMN